MSEFHEFSGDKPISPADEDKLDFKELATKLALSIRNQPTRDGMVLGIEGEWGSGKSSLIKLIEESIKSQNTEDKTLATIWFNPWLIGSRDALLKNLFDTLRSVIENVDLEEPENENDILTTKAKKKLRIHGKKAADLLLKYKNEALALTSSLGSGYWIALARFIAILLGFYDNKRRDLSSIKSELNDELKKAKLRIIVIIDDMDRLTPKEAVEMVRLVKSVADFYGITYILSYDKKILTDSLKHELQVPCGHKYLEKIIQVSFSVPKPEPFVLRNWFQKSLKEAYPNAYAEEQYSGRSDYRLSKIMDGIGNRSFHTPRDVVRALDAVKLHFSHIQDQADLIDMAWLQLTRLKTPEIYNWVAHYMGEISDVYGHTQHSFGDSRPTLEKIKAACEAYNLDFNPFMRELEEILPGLIAGGKDGWQCFKINAIGNKISQFISEKRLGSPNHSRLYFAFSLSQDSILASDIGGILNLTGNPDSSRFTFASKIKKERLVNKIKEYTLTESDPERLKAALDFLARNMDSFAKEIGKDGWGRHSIWMTAEQAVHNIINNASPENRKTLINNLFETGSSICWLSDLMRSDLYAHGRIDQTRKNEDEQKFSADELDNIIKLMEERYKKLTAEDALSSADPLSLLYGWKQSNPDLDLTEWLKEQAPDNKLFLRFIDSLKTWQSINDEVGFTLKSKDIKSLFDIDYVRERLLGMIKSNSLSSEDVETAKSLLKNIAPQDKNDSKNYLKDWD